MIRLRPITVYLSMLALAACGGGGATVSSVGTTSATAGAPTSSQGAASVALSITFSSRAPSTVARRPQYVSPGTASIALYDGSSLVYVANIGSGNQRQFTTVFASSGPTTVNPGSCTNNTTTEVCTATVTTTPGPHVFDLVAYPVSQGGGGTPPPQTLSDRRQTMDVGTPPTFAGVIASEGELAVNLNPGTNPGASLTLLGVASNAVLRAPQEAEAPYNTTLSYAFQIEDSAFWQILTPGNYDNGPVTINASRPGIVTITPSSFTTPPSAPGDQTFNVTCSNPNGGSVGISLNARTRPNTNYASMLAYSPSNYSPGTLATMVLSCDAQPATIPITVK